MLPISHDYSLEFSYLEEDWREVCVSRCFLVYRYWAAEDRVNQ